MSWTELFHILLPLVSAGAAAAWGRYWKQRDTSAEEKRTLARDRATAKAAFDAYARDVHLKRYEDARRVLGDFKASVDSLMELSNRERVIRARGAKDAPVSAPLVDAIRETSEARRHITWLFDDELHKAALAFFLVAAQEARAAINVSADSPSESDIQRFGVAQKDFLKESVRYLRALDPVGFPSKEES